MGTFMNTNKKVIADQINSSNVLEIGQAVTLSFYIREIVQNTDFTTLDYKVDKNVGRTLTELTTWTSISLVGIDDDIYSFDYTAASVTVQDKVQFTFRVIDVDGLESYVIINDFVIIT